ncbi:MAG: glycine--tRNA ligase subunit beta [Desulfobacterales bacterium]|nr:glycine--tRNA ligase subunit beta [Desulfobacterales bacterium]
MGYLIALMKKLSHKVKYLENKMSNELLFEIGTEEIPAGFLSKAVVRYGRYHSNKSLTEKRIPFDGIKCMATPRRLVLYIAEVRTETGRSNHRKNGAGQKGRLR